jgi:septal ring factor EnvC (AmiA/AmiB activator)
MFGGRKRKLEMKNVEDFMKGEHREAPAAEPAGESNESMNKIKRFIPAIAAVVVILVLMIAGSLKINNMASEIELLRAEIKESSEVKGIRSHVSALDAKVQGSLRDTEQLKQHIARLERELDAAKTQRAKAEMPVKKPAADRKKALKPGR